MLIESWKLEYLDFADRPTYQIVPPFYPPLLSTCHSVLSTGGISLVLTLMTA